RALKVAGSHSSKATTWATWGESSSWVPAANSKHKMTDANFSKPIFIIVFLSACQHAHNLTVKLEHRQQLLFPGYKHGNSGIRVGFLGLFLSRRWIVNENSIEVREGQAVDHERALADFEAQGIRAAVVIAGGKAHDANHKGGAVVADGGHDRRGCRVNANAVGSRRQGGFAPAHRGSEVELPGEARGNRLRSRRAG